MTKQKFIAYIGQAVVVILFIIPLVILTVSSSLFFPYITGKAFLFRDVVYLATVLWLFLAILSPEYRPKRSAVLYAFSAFVGVLSLATIFSFNTYNSLWSNFERMEGFIALAHFFLYFLILISALQTKKLWTYFLNTQVGVSVLIGLYGLMQFFHLIPIQQSSVRLDATLGNAGYLGTYMFFTFFVTLLLLIEQWRSKTARYIYLPILALQAFILFQTATRGAILGFLASLVVIGVVYAFQGRANPTVRKTALGLLCGLMIFLGGFYFLKDTTYIATHPVLGRFASISLADNTTKARFMVWDMSLQGVKERPVLGWGQDNFVFVFNKYYNPEMYGQEPWFDRSHNVFFDWLIAGGVLGLLAYLSLFGSAIFYLYKNRERVFTSSEQAILVGLLGGYLFQNLFIFDNISSYILFISILGYIHFKVSSSSQPIFNRVLVKSNYESTAVAIGLVIAVVAVPVFYVVNLKPMLANQNLLKALIAFNSNDPESGLKYFEKVYAYNTFANKEATEQLSINTLRSLQNPNAARQLNQKLVTLTDEQFKNQLAIRPADVRLKLFYADFLRSVGQGDLALQQLNEALTLSPKKQQIYFNLVATYLDKKDYDRALDFAKQAFDLAPDFQEARKMYGLVYLIRGEENKAKEILVPEFGSLVINDDRFINIFANQKKYDLVAQIWQLRLDANPAEINNWLKTALAYYASGQKNKSLQVLSEAIKYNAEFSPEVTELSNLIKANRVEI